MTVNEVVAKTPRARFAGISMSTSRMPRCYEQVCRVDLGGAATVMN